MGGVELSPEILEGLHLIFHRLEQRWLPPLPDTSTYFGYDPLPIALFLDGIIPAMELARGKRFLDIGCGIGTKMAFMHALGYEVSGIDRYEPYIETARELLHSDGASLDLTVADAFSIEKFDADIVYMYRPAIEEDVEEKLERHVVSVLKKGTVLFLPTRRPAFLGEESARHVWVI